MGHLSLKTDKKYTKPLLRKGLIYAFNCPIFSQKVYIVMANNTGIKHGGRQKGTANKATARLREALRVQYG
ncbi:MAG: hypothetical protein ACJA19_000124 [Bacteroidia bacterium]|jgi:hypothetical protein